MRAGLTAAAIGTMFLAMGLAAQTPATQAKPSTTPAAAAKSQPVKITHGPTVEFTANDRAVIAWSTNVSSGTVVRYGLDAKNLAQQAKAPWGSLTHRVTLRNLQPGSQYYFKVESGDGAGTGTSVASDVLQFQTKSSLEAQHPAQ